MRFATASVIESVRRNPELCNFVLNDNDTTSYGFNYLSLMSGQQRQQSFNDIYIALILEEAEKLYNELTTELTNEIITARRSYSGHHHHRYHYHLVITRTNL